jgi:hypothetical protein
VLLYHICLSTTVVHGNHAGVLINWDQIFGTFITEGGDATTAGVRSSDPGVRWTGPSHQTERVSSPAGARTASFQPLYRHPDHWEES